MAVKRTRKGAKASEETKPAQQPVRASEQPDESPSARNRAEEELRRKGAELNEAQRIAHIGSWSWDAKTDTTAGSDELFRIFGLDPATQRFPAFPEFNGRLFSTESWQRLNVAVQESMQTGVGYELEIEALRDGTPVWVTTRGEVE